MTYLIPEKFAAGVKLAIPVLLFTWIVMLFTKVKLYFRVSLSIDMK